MEGASSAVVGLLLLVAVTVALAVRSNGSTTVHLPAFPGGVA